MTIENTDYYVVERNDTLNIVESQSAMTKILDDDLLVIGRGSSPYKITGAEFKQSVGPGPLVPSPDDVSASPAFEGGTGTELDPFIITPVTAAPAGVSVLSAQTITIDGVEGQVGTWTSDNTRFDQPSSVIGSDGTWSGQLIYNDSPETISDTVYTGYPKIGSVCFKWVVTQNVLATSPPTVDSVSLIESNPIADPRFTDQTFVASSQVTEGEPLSTKTIDAHVDGTLTKNIQFNELLESSSTTPEIKYSDGAQSTGGGGFANPVTDAFDGSLDTSLQTNGNTSNGSELWRYTLTQEVADLWNQASALTWYQVRPGVTGSGSINILRNATVDLWNAGPASDSPIPLYGITGPITDWVAGDYLYVTNQAGSSSNGRCYGISYTIDGVETFLVDVPSQTALTFPTNADMEGLAAGDTINQTNVFFEPLESSGDVSLNYSDALSQTGGATDLPAAFDGVFQTKAVMPIGSTIVWDCESFNLPAAEWYLQMFANNGGAINVQVSIACEFRDLPDVSYTLNTNTSGSILVYFTGDVYNGGAWDQISSPTKVTVTYLAGPSGAGDFGLQYVLQNNTVLEDSIVPQLIFPAATDMSALAPGDDVSQPSQVGVQPDYETAGQWLYTTSGTGAWGTFFNSESAFDGNPNTFGSGTSQLGNAQLTKTFSPGIEGDTLIITYPSLQSNYSYSINNGADTPFTTSTAGTTVSIPGGTLTSLKITQVDRIGSESPIWATMLTVDGMVLQSNATIPAPTGTVGSITDTAVTLSSSSGTWVNGADVTTGDKTSIGVVGSVTGTTATLSSSTGAWANGSAVVGPQKTITEENTRLYCAFDSNGNVTDLQNDPQDPPYTTTDSNPGLTFTFPATFPSGQTPDEELPDGTTFTVEVSATNTSGTSGPVSATVQPEPGIPPEPVRPAYLTGLTTLYDGDGVSKSITTGVDLVDNDGLVWIKSRSAGYHVLNDTVRGAQLSLYSNEDLAEGPSVNALTSFTDTGFTIGTGADVNSQSKYEAFTFQKAPGFFDVITYTGDGVGPRTVSHNLASLPGFIIIKRLDSTGDWFCSHKDLTNWGQHIFLNQNTVASGNVSWIGNVTDTQFSVYRTADLNASGATYVAYLFAADTPDVIQCGTFPNTNKVTTGFRPQWLLTRATDNVGDWYIFNDKLPADAQSAGEYGKVVKANTSEAEQDYGYMYFLDDGFQQNYYGAKGIYVAIAVPPPIPVPPGTLEGLTSLYTGNNTVQKITNGLDLVNNDGLVWIKSRSGTSWHELYDTKRGPGNYISSNASNEESFNADSLTSFDTDGFTLNGWSGVNISPSAFVAWAFKQTPGFFDVATSTTGTGITAVPHNLGIAPGFVLVKSSASAYNWFCYHKDLGNSAYVQLNNVSITQTNLVNIWGAGPDADNFYYNRGDIGSANDMFYMFADNPGVIKSGSYTATGAGTSVSVGFKPQWLLVKRTDITDDWMMYDNKRGVNVGGQSEIINSNNDTQGRNGTQWNVEFTSDGFSFPSLDNAINASGGTYIYVAIAEPPAARSQTLLELADTKLKFATFENRSMVQCGNEAEAKRDDLIIELRDQGYLLPDILEHL